MPEMKKLLNATELAEFLNCSRDHVYKLIASNRLKYINIGKANALYSTFRFDPDDLWKERPKLGEK